MASTLLPVNAWDMALAIVSESTFGTTPVPVDAAAYKARFLECINASLGPAAQVGVVRPKQDRGIGRGPTEGFVEGRVEPIEWNVMLSVKSRTANDTPPLELALYKAAGLNCQDAGSTYTLTPSATPIQSGTFAGLSMQRFLGKGAAAYQSEALRGGVARSLKWEGGDKELMLTASGAGVAKRSLGMVTATFLDGSTTTMTLASTEDSYRIDLGYYLIESEVVLVTAFTAGSTAATATRAQLGTTGAAHAAVDAYPYIPALTSQFTGSPIAEATSSVDLAGVAGIRCINWGFELTTGMDLLPGETGSQTIQGALYKRMDAKLNLRLVLSQQQLTMIGRARSRPSVACTVNQGSGTGSLFSIACAQGEIMNFNVPDTANDVAVVDVGLRLRDSAAGNDLFTVTLSGS
jgi:hypothetical protein